MQPCRIAVHGCRAQYVGTIFLASRRDRARNQARLREAPREGVERGRCFLQSSGLLRQTLNADLQSPSLAFRPKAVMPSRSRSIARVADNVSVCLRTGRLWAKPPALVFEDRPPKHDAAPTTADSLWLVEQAVARGEIQPRGDPVVLGRMEVLRERVAVEEEDMLASVRRQSYEERLWELWLKNPM